MLPIKKVLTLDAAKQMADGARSEAQANGWKMVIAIVDDAGELLYLERMDGAQLGSLMVAQQKAQTAARFRRSTKVFEDAIAGGRSVILSLPGVLPVEGGLPILVDGQVVGAIGASGGSSTEDGAVAAAGIAEFLAWQVANPPPESR
jgi:glc operon protein GlcG